MERIWAQNNSDTKGAIYSFTHPLDKLSRKIGIGVLKNEMKIKILAVDDEPDVTFTLRATLESSGFFHIDSFNES